MSTTKSRLAYTDCFDFMDQAVADSKGIRVCVGAESNLAYTLRFRLNSARQIDRNENAKTYEEGHPLHGRSIYDRLVFRVKEDSDGEWWVYLEIQDTSNAYVEPLGETA